MRVTTEAILAAATESEILEWLHSTAERHLKECIDTCGIKAVEKWRKNWLSGKNRDADTTEKAIRKVGFCHKERYLLKVMMCCSHAYSDTINAELRISATMDTAANAAWCKYVADLSDRPDFKFSEISHYAEDITFEEYEKQDRELEEIIRRRNQ